MDTQNLIKFIQKLSSTAFNFLKNTQNGYPVDKLFIKLLSITISEGFFNKEKYKPSNCKYSLK